MGSVPDRFEVIRQVRWAGRRFYLAHDWEQERRVYLIQCWAGVDPAAYNHPSLPVVEALPDTDGEWLMVRPVAGESLAEMRTAGRLTEELLGDLLLSVMDGLAYLGRMVPAMVPAYVDPRYIKMGPDGWVVDYVAAAVHSSDARWSDGVMPVAYPMGGLINWLFTGKSIQVGLSRPRAGWIPPWISPDLQAIMRRCLDRAYADPEDLRRDLMEVVEGKGLQGLAEKLRPEPKKERRQPAQRVREDEEQPRDAAPEPEAEEREASSVVAEEPRQAVEHKTETQAISEVRQDLGERPQPHDGGEDFSEPAAAAAESQPAEDAAEQTRPRVRRKVEGLRGSTEDLARLKGFAGAPEPAPQGGHQDQQRAPAAPPEAGAAAERYEPSPARPAEPAQTAPQARAPEKPKRTARVVRLGGSTRRSKPQGRPQQRPVHAAARAPEEPQARPAQEEAWYAEAPRTAREEHEVRETRGSRGARSGRKASSGKRQGQERLRWITLIAGTLVVALMVWFGVRDIQARIAAARGENIASRDRQSQSSQVDEPPATEPPTVEPTDREPPTTSTPEQGQRNQEPSVILPWLRNPEPPAQEPSAPQTKPNTPPPQDEETAPSTKPEEGEGEQEPSGPAPIPPGYDYMADKAAGGMPLEVVVDGTTLGTFYLFPSPTKPQVSLHALNRFLGSNLHWEGIDLETVKVYEGDFSMVTKDFTIINDRLWLHLTPAMQDILGLRVTGYKDGQIQFTRR